MGSRKEKLLLSNKKINKSSVEAKETEEDRFLEKLMNGDRIGEMQGERRTGNLVLPIFTMLKGKMTAMKRSKARELRN